MPSNHLKFGVFLIIFRPISLRKRQEKCRTKKYIIKSLRKQFLLAVENRKSIMFESFAAPMDAEFSSTWVRSLDKETETPIDGTVVGNLKNSLIL